MKKLRLPLTLLASSLLILTSCSSDDDTVTEEVQEETIDRVLVTDNYANIVLSNYQDALADARTLQSEILTFTTTPNEGNFNAAKQAWLGARESYGTTEAFRFANGPIDSGDTEETEGLLNSWPLDEAYIDYVAGDATAGIINNPAAFPTIDKATLTNQNGLGGEENVSVGYHAIEFLLWGQDLTDPSADMPGQRTFNDFVAGQVDNADRRAQYLNVCADLLIDHLQVMINEWTSGYVNTFKGQDTDTNLENIINSLAELSRSELAIERIAVALQNQDQEDEHSCFSDNTHRDIRLNLEGVANVYRGNYGALTGPSLEDLIEEADENLAMELDTLLSDAITKVDVTAIPFDLAISEGETSVEGAKVQEAVQALVAFGDKLLEAKATLGL